MFITFEGTDGSGKSTQVKAITAKLREQGYKIITTREPGGTAIGDQIRAIVLDNLENTDMVDRTELLLFCASRAQLVHELILPTIERGGIILCDRYADSTLAYQGYGHGLDLQALRDILHFATSGLQPDITMYLDLKPEIGLERRHQARFEGEDWNRLDDKEIAYHQRVYDGYQQIIKNDPSNRWVRINANQTQAVVTKNIWDALQSLL